MLEEPEDTMIIMSIERFLSALPSLKIHRGSLSEFSKNPKQLNTLTIPIVQMSKSRHREGTESSIMN